MNENKKQIQCVKTLMQASNPKYAGLLIERMREGRLHELEKYKNFNDFVRGNRELSTAMKLPVFAIEAHQKDGLFFITEGTDKRPQEVQFWCYSRRFIYNSKGRLMKMKAYKNSGELVYSASYTFDADQNLINAVYTVPIRRAGCSIRTMKIAEIWHSGDGYRRLDFHFKQGMDRYTVMDENFKILCETILCVDGADDDEDDEE